MYIVCSNIWLQHWARIPALTPLPMSSITKGTLNLVRKVSVSHEQRERQRVIAAEDTETKG